MESLAGDSTHLLVEHLVPLVDICNHLVRIVLLLPLGLAEAVGELSLCHVAR